MNKNIELSRFISNIHSLQDVLNITFSDLKKLFKTENSNFEDLRYELLEYLNKNKRNFIYFEYQEENQIGRISFKLLNYDSTILKIVLKDSVDELDLTFRYNNLELQQNPHLFYSKRLSIILNSKKINTKIIENLIKLGADVNYSNMIISVYNNFEILEILLKNGANPSINDENALRMLASESKLISDRIGSDENNIKCANLLVEYGANILEAISVAEKKESYAIARNLKEYYDSFPLSDVKVAK